MSSRQRLKAFSCHLHDLRPVFLIILLSARKPAKQGLRERFVTQTRCSFPTSPHREDCIFLLFLYYDCYRIGSYHFLKLSCWRKASGTDSASPHFYTSQAHCVNNHFCWSQRREHVIILKRLFVPVPRWKAFIQLNKWKRCLQFCLHLRIHRLSFSLSLNKSLIVRNMLLCHTKARMWLILQMLSQQLVYWMICSWLFV